MDKNARVFGDMFARLAAMHPTKPALRDRSGAHLSFGLFNQRINRLNHAVAQLGVRPGSRVAILAKNSIGYVELFGLAKTGIVIVPLNWRLSQTALQGIVLDCQPEIIFADDEFLPTALALSDAMAARPALIAMGAAAQGALPLASLIEMGEDREPQSAVAPDDPLCIIYTSGTTGAPKGVLHSHRTALDNMRVSSELAQHLTPDDTVMAVMPLFHIGGLLLHFFSAFYAGCITTILAEFSPKSVLETIRDHQITNVHLVPTMIAAVLDRYDAAPVDVSSLKTILYAASPIPSSLLKRALLTLPGCGFLQSYGATESGMVTALTAQQHVAAQRAETAQVLLSCGQPLADRAVRIRAGDSPCAPHDIGEIEVKSAGLMAGYWNNAEASGKAVIDGWLKTGDLGYIDDKGFVYIVDRKNDMIITGGENVYPTEVEEHLCRLEGVAAAAVFGVPDPRWVEKVAAAIVQVPGAALSANAVMEAMKSELAAYKCPKSVFFVADLPKNATGKVLRKELRQMVLSGQIA
ncbi:MAG: AMP-binding protein [Pseudomonadota bacterium]